MPSSLTRTGSPATCSGCRNRFERIRGSRARSVRIDGSMACVARLPSDRNTQGSISRSRLSASGTVRGPGHGSKRSGASCFTRRTPKMQVVYDTQRARRARPRLPKCTTRNRELGSVFIDEAVTGFADSKSLADEISILLGQKNCCTLEASVAQHQTSPSNSSTRRNRRHRRLKPLSAQLRHQLFRSQLCPQAW